MSTSLVETTLSQETLFRGQFLNVINEKVCLPNGKIAYREYFQHPGAVMVLPCFDDGSVLIEKQWRVPLHQVFIEFPAGKFDAHETHWIDCAKRELNEETGLKARQFAYMTAIHNAIGYSDEVLHLVCARDFVPGMQSLDEHEFLTLERIRFPEIMQAIAERKITDVKTIIGAFWYEKTLSTSTWPALDWISV